MDALVPKASRERISSNSYQHIPEAQTLRGLDSCWSLRAAALTGLGGDPVGGSCAAPGDVLACPSSVPAVGLSLPVSLRVQGAAEAVM